MYFSSNTFIAPIYIIWLEIFLILWYLIGLQTHFSQNQIEVLDLHNHTYYILLESVGWNLGYTW